MEEQTCERAEASLAPPQRCRPSSVLCLLSSALFLTACGAEQPTAPSLSDSLMVDVLVEVHLADARAAHTGESRDSLRAAALAPFGLDTLAFRQALDYYAQHPGLYAPVYTRALDQVIRERRLEEEEP
ncbi:MAG: DUF4296 domain-containing protein [Bacteroidota bacterium]